MSQDTRIHLRPQGLACRLYWILFVRPSLLWIRVTGKAPLFFNLHAPLWGSLQMKFQRKYILAGYRQQFRKDFPAYRIVPISLPWKSLGLEEYTLRTYTPDMPEGFDQAIHDSLHKAIRGANRWIKVKPF